MEASKRRAGSFVCIRTSPPCGEGSWRVSAMTRAHEPSNALCPESCPSATKCLQRLVQRQLQHQQPAQQPCNTHQSEQYARPGREKGRGRARGGKGNAHPRDPHTSSPVTSRPSLRCQGKTVQCRAAAARLARRSPWAAPRAAGLLEGHSGGRARARSRQRGADNVFLEVSSP